MSDNITTSVMTPALNTEINMRGLLSATLSTPINQKTKTLTNSKELMNSVTIVAKKPTIRRLDDLPINASIKSEEGAQIDNPTSAQILFDTPLMNGDHNLPCRR